MDKRRLFRILAAGLLAGPAPAASQTCQAPQPLQFADLGGPHVSECSALNPSSYPPTSGRHFPIWAKPGTYKAVLNPGYWLHSAEHGAVIFLINCKRAPDCLADFDRFQAIAGDYPADNACAAADRHRIIIAGDTAITTRYAAVAWNWSLGSDCLDSAAFAAFLKDHYNRAPEDICGGGTDFAGAIGCNAPLGLRRPREGTSRPRSRTVFPSGRFGWPGLPADIRPDGKARPSR